MNIISSERKDDDNEEEGNQKRRIVEKTQTSSLKKEAETLRRLAFSALCFASVSLITAVLMVPLIITNARTVQTAIDQESNGCLAKLAQLYNKMDQIDEQPNESTVGNRRTTSRPTRHVPKNTRNKLKQVLNNQRKSRYLQQKVAETAALLNSQEVWEDFSPGLTTKNKDDVGSASEDGAASRTTNENDNEGAANGENSSPVDSGGGHSISDLQNEFIGSSSSFEISSEQHWYSHHPEQKGSEYDYTTFFTLPPFSRVSPRIHSKEVTTRQSPATASTTVMTMNDNDIGYPTTATIEAYQQQQMPTVSDEQDQCCACAFGRPGPPGFPGTDGQPGRDGQPGLNGQNGKDAQQQGPPKPRVDDFCFNCPRGPIGEIGPAGPKGAPGEAGRPGEDGEDGQKGSQGGMGPTGIAGKEGKPGPPGRQGMPGKVTLISGPEGPEGRPGKLGPPGSPGPAGQPGFSEPGRPGPTGEPGLDGQNGSVGMVGKSGIPGIQGSPGGCMHCNAPRTAPGY